MVIFFIILTIWLIIGGSIGIFLFVQDQDLKFNDLGVILFTAAIGPFMIIGLFEEGYLKMPKLTFFGWDGVLIKKRKK